MELISGWEVKSRGRDHVVLAWRDESGELRARRFPARWSFFVLGADETDRAAIQRLKSVVSVEWSGDYLRVDCNNRWDRRRLAESIEEMINVASLSGSIGDAAVREADVGPLRRLIADHSTLSVSTDHRVGYLDIEVDSRPAIDDQVAGKARILCWALSRDGAEPIGALLQEDTDAAERELLEQLLEAMGSCDLIIAWYGDGYDFPVISKRIARMDARLPSGAPPEINRWCWMDHLVLFEKYNRAVAGSGDEKASLALGSVAQRIAGVTKIDFDASKTWEAWEAGGPSRDELLRYCIRDTSLLPAIEAETGYVALHREVCRTCHVFPDTSSLGAVAQGDGFLMRLGAERGYRWPTKQHVDEAPVPFEGAYVMEPTKLGAIEGVSVADFTGLYPSIMRSWNLSPETVLTPNEARALDVPRASVPERRTLFRTDVRGLVPEALDRLVEERQVYKDEMKLHAPGSVEWKRAFRLSTALKIVANSFYGIVGSPWSRFHNHAVAEAVTTTGAWLLKQVVAASKAGGLDPFYGDTDSIFVQGDPERFAQIVAELNAGWAETLRERFNAPRCHIELDYEKRFRRLVIVSAKRYAAVLSWYKGRAADPDAPLEVKGLEYKRGDTLRVAREMQREAIGMLLREGPVPDPAEMWAQIERWKSKVYEGRLSLDDLVLSQRIKALSEYSSRYTAKKCPKPCSHDYGGWEIDGPELCPSCGNVRKQLKPPAHVRVALELISRGGQVAAGNRIRYLIRAGESDGLNAVPAEDIESNDELDLDYYWLKRILPPTARVLDVVHPGQGWIPTAKERKAEERQRWMVANRGKVDDLPLFGGAASADPSAPPAISGKAPRAPKRRRRREKASKSPPGVFAVFKASATTKRHLAAARARAEAHPGPIRFWIRIVLDDLEGTPVATIDTGLTVSKGRELTDGLKAAGAVAVTASR